MITEMISTDFAVALGGFRHRRSQNREQTRTWKLGLIEPRFEGQPGIL